MPAVEALKRSSRFPATATSNTAVNSRVWPIGLRILRTEYFVRTSQRVRPLRFEMQKFAILRLLSLSASPYRHETSRVSFTYRPFPWLCSPELHRGRYYGPATFNVETRRAERHAFRRVELLGEYEIYADSGSYNHSTCCSHIRFRKHRNVGCIFTRRDK